jgi:hypothetical protein
MNRDRRGPERLRRVRNNDEFCMTVTFLLEVNE